MKTKSHLFTTFFSSLKKLRSNENSNPKEKELGPSLILTICNVKNFEKMHYFLPYKIQKNRPNTNFDNEACRWDTWLLRDQLMRKVNAVDLILIAAKNETNKSCHDPYSCFAFKILYSFVEQSHSNFKIIQWIQRGKKSYLKLLFFSKKATLKIIFLMRTFKITSSFYE